MVEQLVPGLARSPGLTGEQPLHEPALHLSAKELFRYALVALVSLQTHQLRVGVVLDAFAQAGLEVQHGARQLTVHLLEMAVVAGKKHVLSLVGQSLVGQRLVGQRLDFVGSQQWQQLLVQPQLLFEAVCALLH